MKRFRGMQPAPVYEATFADGTTGRMSFWSEKGKPLDYERGRRVLSTCFARPAERNTFNNRIGADAPRILRCQCEKAGCCHSFVVRAENEAAVDAAVDASVCPKCGGSDFRFDVEIRRDHHSDETIAWPAVEIVDGYVEVDGVRHRDPLFDPHAAALPAKRKGAHGIALVASVIEKLTKDGTPEAREAARLLRQGFGLAEAA